MRFALLKVPSAAGLAFLGLSLAGFSAALAQTTGAISPRPAAGGAFNVYEPAAPQGEAGKDCAPVAIVSRGLGAGQNPMRSLAQSLAQQGWRVIVMRHLEGGRAVFQGRLVRAGRLQPSTGDESNAAALKTRARELDSAVELAKKTCQPPFMALIGHAVGSTTTLIEAGAKPRFQGLAGKDRFDAYVAISPAGAGSVFARDSWAAIAKPVLVITGTRDRVGSSGPRARTAAFDGMPSGSKRLAIIPGATHFALGGLGSGAVRAKVAGLTTEFLSQLRSGGLKPTATGVETRDK